MPHAFATRSTSYAARCATPADPSWSVWRPRGCLETLHAAVAAEPLGQSRRPNGDRTSRFACEVQLDEDVAGVFSMVSSRRSRDRKRSRVSEPAGTTEYQRSRAESGCCRCLGESRTRENESSGDGREHRLARAAATTHRILDVPSSQVAAAPRRPLESDPVDSLTVRITIGQAGRRPERSGPPARHVHFATDSAAAGTNDVIAPSA